MKRTFIYLAILFLAITWSCNDDCEGVSCFTPPASFNFQLVDKSTRENLFTTGALNADDITVKNLDDQSIVKFDFIEEDEHNIIKLHTIGWQTEIVNYSIEISKESIFTLYVDTEAMHEGCCAFTRYNEVKIDGSDYEFLEHTGIYKILVE